MGFFSKLQKRNLTGEAVASFTLKVAQSPDTFLRKFVYTSVACTNIFFDNFFEDGKEFSYLKKYKSYLTKENTYKVFKLFALYDFDSYMTTLKANDLSLDNEIEYERKIQFIFDCTEADINLHHTLHNLDIQKFSPTFYYILLNQCLIIPVQSNDKEIGLMEGMLFNRLSLFSKLLVSR